MHVSIVVKMVIDHSNVRNQKRLVAVQVVVENDQVNNFFMKDERYNELFLDACFNCGKDGHRSFECSEPKKAGGREQSSML
jgi:hypothetical protein